MNGTWLVTGSGGLLGQDVLTGLREAGETATGLDHKALDITDAHAVREVMAKHRPAIVVNCAAFAAPDKAENDEEGALRINGGGARILATACAEFEARLIHVSTDYVFAGDDSGGVAVPFAEDAPTCPVNAYGRTKVAGERAVLECLPETGYVFRTAWLFGAGRTNFVRTMIRLERERDQVEVVADQCGQPTWTVDAADQLIRLGRAALDGRAPAGAYHGSAGGQASWYELAQEVFRLLGADPERVRPSTGAAFGRPAPRPAYSVLGHARWQAVDIEPIRHWRAGLEAAFPSLVRAEDAALPA
ncbi:dTDP-4-dehydrorhamnose reductase [Streptomyces sp. NPDC005900]|uniref:dTDP-4-dehydrorhamnose reductase n=1 Tax=Streptomyces sp. NPDC005900 TaxID=3154569 RepID=UPI0033C6D3FA